MNFNRKFNNKLVKKMPIDNNAYPTKSSILSWFLFIPFCIFFYKSMHNIIIVYRFQDFSTILRFHYQRLCHFFLQISILPTDRQGKRVLVEIDSRVKGGQWDKIRELYWRRTDRVICKHPRNRETYCTKVKRLNRPANGKSYKNRRMNFKFMILKKTGRQTDKGMVKQILSNG